jgi:hypothetical protein
MGNLILDGQTNGPKIPAPKIDGCLCLWYRPTDSLQEIEARLEAAKALFPHYKGNLLCRPYRPKRKLAQN